VTITGPRTYTCPRCPSTVTLIGPAIQVGHRCERHKRQWVDWREETEPTRTDTVSPDPNRGGQP
jgi:hypothetical protein